MKTPETAAEIDVEGRVQGVGYRDFVRRRASALGLSGWVMNLDDGRVRLHAEGPRARIDDLVRALRQGPRLARVERVEVRWTTPTGAFGEFDVRLAESGA